MNYKKKLGALFGASLIAQLIQFAGIAWLARVYSPDTFGEYGFYAGLASLVAVISGFRFEYLAFSDSARKIDQPSYIKISLVFASSLSIIAAISIYSLRLQFPDHTSIEIWAPSFIFASAIFYLGTQSVLLRAEFYRFGIYRIIQALMQLVLSLMLFYILPKTGLLLGIAGSQALIGIGMLAWYFQNHDRPLEAITIKSLWIQKWRQGASNTVFTGLQYCTPFAPILFGTIYFSKEDVGAYFVLSQLFAAPLTILRRSLISFYLVEFPSEQQLASFLTARQTPLKRSALLVAVALAIAMIIVHAHGSALVSFAIGENWNAFAGMLMPLALYFLMDTLLQPLTTLLPLWDRARFAILVEMLRVVALFPGGYFFIAIFHPSFMQFILYFFCTMACVYIFQVQYMIQMVYRQRS